MSSTNHLEESLAMLLHPKSILKKSPSPRLTISKSTFEIFDSSTGQTEENYPYRIFSPDAKIHQKKQMITTATMKDTVEVTPSKKSFTRSNPNLSQCDFDRRIFRRIPSADTSSDSSNDFAQARRIKFKTKRTTNRSCNNPTVFSSSTEDLGNRNHSKTRKPSRRSASKESAHPLHGLRSTNEGSISFLPLQFLFNLARRSDQDRRVKTDCLRRYIEEHIGITAFLTLYKLIKSSNLSIDLHAKPFSAYVKFIPHLCCLIMLENEQEKYRC